MRIRLTRKLANCLDGVDVSNLKVGDVIDLPVREARMLVAERWAVLERRFGEQPRPEPERRRQDALPPEALPLGRVSLNGGGR